MALVSSPQGSGPAALSSVGHRWSGRARSACLAAVLAIFAVVVTLSLLAGDRWEEGHARIASGRRLGDLAQSWGRPSEAAASGSELARGDDEAAASATSRALSLAHIPDNAGVLVPPASSSEPRTFTPSKPGACLKLIHIPKTGGTSLEGVYSRNRVDKRVMGWGRLDKKQKCTFHLADERKCHMPHGVVCNPWHVPPMAAKGLWESGYRACDTFCVVRHPIDKVVSEWQYQTKQTCSNKSFASYVREELGGVIAGNHYHKDCHWVPAYEYVYDFSTSRRIRTCRHVLRFERLPEDFDALMKAYNYSMTLPQQKAFGHKPCNLFIPPDIQEMIRMHYAADYGMFSYS